MSVVARPLVDSDLVLLVSATQYTAPSSTRTIIDKATVFNTSGSSVTITIFIVPNGITKTSSHTVLTQSIGANATAELSILKNHSLDTGDFLVTEASDNNVLTLRISGREVS